MAARVIATSLFDSRTVEAPASKAALVIAFDWRDAQPRTRTSTNILSDAVWCMASLEFAGELKRMGVDWSVGSDDADTERAALKLLSAWDVTVESDQPAADNEGGESKGKATA